jgi:multidrug resistance efflux pump
MKLNDLFGKLGIKRPDYTARFWVILIVCIVVVLIIYYALLDRYTPYTSDAYIQAYVVQVAPQVEGRVVAVYVENNQFVQEGEKLFSLDPRPYEYQVEQQRAELVQAKQEVDQYESDIKAAEQVVKQSQADLTYAQKLYDDLLPLAQKNYIARIELDRAIDKLNSQKAVLNQSIAEYERTKQALEYTIDGEFALIRQMESQLAYYRYQLEQTTVYASVDGFVTNLQLVSGSYIDVGDAVLTLVDDDNWWVVANFRENSVGRIREGQKAEITISLYPGKIFEARIESTDWGVSAGQGVPSGDLPDVENPENWISISQRFPVRLTITDLNEEQYPLRIGGSASVAVYTGRNFILNGLAGLWLRIGSLIDYIY